MAKSNLTAENLRELLYYDKNTGVFTNLSKRGRLGKGKESGYTRPDRYVEIKLHGESYLAHRLAWLYVHGEWPTKHLDHIDNDPSNNRIGNLRDVSRHTNQQNRKGPQSNNKSGHLGVYFGKQEKKYIARIGYGGKRVFRKGFTNLEDAIAARKEAELIFHPDKP